MQSNSLRYIKIDHNNCLRLLNDEQEQKISLGWYMTCISMKDSTIGKELNNYFALFLNPKLTDQHKINLSLLKQFLKKKNLNDKRLSDSMNYLLNKDYKMTFEFTPDNISTLSTAVFYCINYLKSYKKDMNYSDFLSEINKINEKNIDILAQYFDKNLDEEWNFNRASFVSNYTTNNSYSMKNMMMNNNSNNNIIRPSSSISKSFFYDNVSDNIICNGSFCTTDYTTNTNYNYIYSTKIKNNILSKSMLSIKNENSKKIFKYTRSYKKEYPPKELIIWWNIFQKIRKLTWTIENIDDAKQMMESYLLILLNVDWLFPNMIEIECNYQNENLQAELNKICSRRSKDIIRKVKWNAKSTGYSKEYTIQNYNWKPLNEHDICEFDIYDIRSASSFGGQSISNSTNRQSTNINININNLNDAAGSLNGNADQKAKTLSNIIKNNTEKFDLIIIFSYFLSKWLKRWKILTLSFNDSFNREIEYYFKIWKLQILNFQFLTFISDVTLLAKWEVNFNSLDINNFEKIIGLIYNNASWSVLRLNLFTPEMNYSPSNWYKLCNSWKMNLKPVFEDRQNIMETSFDDIDHEWIKRLLPAFEDNLGKLFFVLKNKFEWTEWIIYMAWPGIIANNDQYNILFIKLLFNILIMLSCSVKNKIRTFKFISPLLDLDTRKNEDIQYFINNIKMRNDNNSLKNITFQARWNRVINLSNLISEKINILFLGDFDTESLVDFCRLFKNKTFCERSQLFEIKISLNTIITQFSSVQEAWVDYFNCGILNLKEQSLYSYIQIENEEMEFLINLVSFNNVIKHNFEFMEMGNRDNEDIIYFGKNIPYLLPQQQKDRLEINEILKRMLGKWNCKGMAMMKIICEIERFVYWGCMKEVTIKLNQN